MNNSSESFFNGTDTKLSQSHTKALRFLIIKTGIEDRGIKRMVREGKTRASMVLLSAHSHTPADFCRRGLEEADSTSHSRSGTLGKTIIGVHPPAVTGPRDIFELLDQALPETHILDFIT